MIFTVVVYIEVADLNNDKKVYSESKKIFNKCKRMLPLLITEVNLIYYFVIVLYDFFRRYYCTIMHYINNSPKLQTFFDISTKISEIRKCRVISRTGFGQPVRLCSDRKV